ncbi:GNAT family N-acetyltransferase [Streptomyces sp. IBSBF 2435]|uniref:GNAT family N-acetyltransferase n=1 Tax=Streptomyces sp. IBSBF 2435 TaxID=2903531 RepID=UPI002FDC6A75
MTIDLRALAAEDWEEFCLRLVRAFGGPGGAPEVAVMWRGLLPVERAIAARVDGGTAGTAGAFDFRMRLPGGALLDTAGVTTVSVQPTHRRRGVLSAMMRRQLGDFHERGTAVAVLTAPEPSVYGRFARRHRHPADARRDRHHPGHGRGAAGRRRGTDAAGHPGRGRRRLRGRLRPCGAHPARHAGRTARLGAAAAAGPAREPRRLRRTAGRARRDRRRGARYARYAVRAGGTTSGCPTAASSCAMSKHSVR